MKSWYQSKTVWLNVILTATLILGLASETFDNATILLFVQGIGNIILRVWFTDTEIER